MPRESAASLGVISATSLPRPAPPSSMPEDEAEIWNQTLQGLPPAWISPGALPLLEVRLHAPHAGDHGRLARGLSST
jgi:hypothetical protein